MKKIVCELCGSGGFTKDNDGLFVCDHCRTKYTPQHAQKMMVEGVVQVDRSKEVEKLITLAKYSIDHENLEKELFREKCGALGLMMAELKKPTRMGSIAYSSSESAFFSDLSSKNPQKYLSATKINRLTTATLESS